MSRSSRRVLQPLTVLGEREVRCLMKFGGRFPGSNCDSDAYHAIKNVAQTARTYGTATPIFPALMPLCFRADFPTATTFDAGRWLDSLRS